MNMSLYDEDDRNTPEYKLGVAQLKEWHERCKAKRLGTGRKDKSVKCWRVKDNRRRRAMGGKN